MKLPLKTQPAKICLLRLSAVGDICHMLPIVRTIQKFWPDTEITWVIGKLEYTLVCDIPDIKFIIFDKSKGFSAYLLLRQYFKNKSFDVLLHMQMSLRASIASLFIPANIKLGFDRNSAKDGQWLFTNHKLKNHAPGHVIDNFFNFIETLGLNERDLSWNLPIPENAQAYADKALPDSKQYLIISPCSSMSYRNWSTENYAAIADYAQDKFGLTVVLTGGPASIEAEYGTKIEQDSKFPVINLIGKTNLKQLCAILNKALIIIAPDSGPAHIATALNIPVIGLYATTNPRRARPYLSGQYTINRYDEAISDKFSKTVEQLPWGTRVRDEG
ncbi:MAG: glycosyltransferase family 9 protein, partial [Gammaproteobacteria bacterium]